MKFLGQTNDGAVDNLLRAYVSRPTNPHQACPDFDPDRANAYIERNLTGASRLQYEAHLAECASCRKSVVALARLAAAETLSATVPARESSRSVSLSGFRKFFGALSQPQWAMAAAAVIVLAISLPLFLSRTRVPDSSPAIAQSGAAPIASAPASPTSGDIASSPTGAAAKQPERRDEKTEASAKAPAAPKVSAPPAVAGAMADLSKKPEITSAEQTDEKRQTDNRVAQAPPAQGGAAPGSQVAKNASDQGRQQQTEKDAQQAGESKAIARADEPSNKKENEGRVEEAAPPPSPASSSEVSRSRAGLRQPGKLALRDSATGESVRADERKYGGKKFVFRDGAWTDKDFKPDKDLPIVTIIRDSNVYKELLSKRAGLRSIMDRFTPTERAIIVYKGTVYKLIPQ